MTAIALLIYLAGFILLLAGTITILYHFRRFRVGGSYSGLIAVFIAGSAFLFLAGFTAFASVDWEAVFALIINLPKR